MCWHMKGSLGEASLPKPANHVSCLAHKRGASMKQKTLLVALAMLLAACGGAQPEAPNSQATPVATEDKIIAEAKVVPGQRAALSFEIGGTVAEVLVKEGDTISAGQVIARLDRAAKAVDLARA